MGSEGPSQSGNELGCVRAGHCSAPPSPQRQGGDAVKVRRGLGHMQGAREPVCTGQVLKSLQGASPKDDGEDRRKNTVLTRIMVEPAIRAQDRDPGPETTMLSQWDAEQETVGPARSSTGLL